MPTLSKPAWLNSTLMPNILTVLLPTCAAQVATMFYKSNDLVVRTFSILVILTTLTQGTYDMQLYSIQYTLIYATVVYRL